MDKTNIKSDEDEDEQRKLKHGIRCNFEIFTTHLNIETSH